MSIPQPVLPLDQVVRTPEQGAEDGWVHLDRNERVGGLPDWFLQTIREALMSPQLTDYPMPGAFQRELAAHLGVSEARVVLTPGSDAAFKSLYQAYVRPGDTVVMLDPSYAMYAVYAQMFGARARPVGFSPTRELDPHGLLTAVTPGVRLVLLANPNQPTGTSLSDDLLQEVARRAAAVGALLVVDEAYYPFSGHTILPWLDRTPNVLLTRTFSKAAGLAGLRLGVAVGHPEVIATLSKLRAAHEINSLAILCAVQVLSHPEIIESYVADVQAGSRVLQERLTAMGLTPIPTPTNFMLVDLGVSKDPVRLVAALRRRRYLIKGPFEYECLARCIRVTLGPPDIMKRFASVLEEELAHAER